MLFFSRDLGIDLGTSNVLIYAAGRGIVLREPSVIALDKNSGKVLQVGAAARSMLGRTPGNVVAVHPLQDGVISDYELTARMLTEMLRRVLRHAIVKPRMIVTVPSGITEVEERAVIQAAMEAGARRVYLIEAPLAAALGAQLDITAPEGRMVVDIGGGTTDIGVLTMNGIAQSASLKVAGAAFDEAIIRHLRRRYGLLIGTTVAEEIKMSIGCVTPRPEALTMTVKGRDLKNGLAREAQWVVVLGAGVNGTVPSQALRERLEAAQDYLARYPEAIAVLSGAQGDGEAITEAQCMYDWLTARGVDPARLRMETKATTTEENLRCSLDLIEAETGTRPAQIAVISGEYHLLRAELLARRAGAEALGVPSYTHDRAFYCLMLAREVCGVWAALLF